MCHWHTRQHQLRVTMTGCLITGLATATAEETLSSLLSHLPGSQVSNTIHYSHVDQHKLRVTMTDCLITGLAWVAEEQISSLLRMSMPRNSQHNVPLTHTTTPAQSNYDWLSHHRTCHSNGGRNTFITAVTLTRLASIKHNPLYPLLTCRPTQAQSNYDWLSHHRTCLSSRRTSIITAAHVNAKKQSTQCATDTHDNTSSE